MTGNQRLPESQPGGGLDRKGEPSGFSFCGVSGKISLMPTEQAIQRHREWKEFIDALKVVIEEDGEGCRYYFRHPVYVEPSTGTFSQEEDDRVDRGWFPTREAALESANAVIALKWPEPQLLP